RYAQLARLNHDGAERLELHDAGPLTKGAQRVGSGQANLHLLQYPGELAGDGSTAVAIPDDLSKRGIEAEARLHADGERIQDVRQRARDLLLPALGQVVDDQVWQEEPQHGAGRSAGHCAKPAPDDQPYRRTHDAHDDETETLDLEDTIHRPVGRVPR